MFYVKLDPQTQLRATPKCPKHRLFWLCFTAGIAGNVAVKLGWGSGYTDRMDGWIQKWMEERKRGWINGSLCGLIDEWVCEWKE